jgi:hypothetical protein
MLLFLYHRSQCHHYIQFTGGASCKVFYLGSLDSSTKTSILAEPSVSVSDTVSDMDLPPIIVGYVLEKYCAIKHLSTWLRCGGAPESCRAAATNHYTSASPASSQKKKKLHTVADYGRGAALTCIFQNVTRPYSKLVSYAAVQKNKVLCYTPVKLACNCQVSTWLLSLKILSYWITSTSCQVLNAICQITNYIVAKITNYIVAEI